MRRLKQAKSRDYHIIRYLIPLMFISVTATPVVTPIPKNRITANQSLHREWHLVGHNNEWH